MTGRNSCLFGVHWTFAEAKREEFVRYLLTIACEEQMQLSIVTITAAPAALCWLVFCLPALPPVQRQLYSIFCTYYTANMFICSDALQKGKLAAPTGILPHIQALHRW